MVPSSSRGRHPESAVPPRRAFFLARLLASPSSLPSAHGRREAGTLGCPPRLPDLVKVVAPDDAESVGGPRARRQLSVCHTRPNPAALRRGDAAEGAEPVSWGGSRSQGQGAVLGRVVPELSVPRLLSTPFETPVTR